MSDYSLVEWHEAHVIPMDASLSPSKIPFTPHNRIKLQKGKCNCRVIQINLPGLQFVLYILWDSFGVNFKSERKSCWRWKPCSNTAVCLSGNSFMQSQLSAPVSLITKRIISEYFSSFVNLTISYWYYLFRRKCNWICEMKKKGCYKREKK